MNLDHCMLRDCGLFIRRFRHIKDRHKQGKPTDKSLEKLQADIAVSTALVKHRQSLVPVIEFPEELPVAARREEIQRAIESSQVVIVAGETGSGKTTQIPKICLELGRGVKGVIGHTQPRRIAARTVADRIAQELQTPLGDLVGYQVRFADHSSDNTLIKLMTDGILLAEIQRDPLLYQYDTLIIDEAHERSLNIDFLLGYIKSILPKRSDLKVIITSATIDVERFSRHFDDAPVISVSGRTYPVDIWYRPPLENDEDIYSAVVDAVAELLSLPKRGDILVFLSGEREIREASAALRKAGFPHLDVLPLYARLSLADQTRIFQPHKGVRVILATNVAETSITVPGIRYVVDTGYARISRYSYRTKVQRLPIEPISQASANQRAGRCGRLSDGVCIRLYSEEDFKSRSPFTDPEIVRTNLAAVILQMLQMRIGDIRNFPFVDAPDNRLINDGYQLLTELEAVDSKGQLSQTGKILAKLPVDPRIGKMLATASEQGALREVLVIAAMLSLQDPRERPADKRQAADEKHRQWQDKESDFSSMLQLWQHFEEQRQALSRRKFSDYCHKNFISYLRMREWRDLHHQLHLACRQASLIENRQPASYESLHRALLSGLLSHVGFRHEEREYLGVRNRKFHIFPGSGVAKKPPNWLMGGEVLETSRLFAHQVARIEPEWIPPLAQHLIRKTHSEPYYDSRRGQVMAFERQTLFGLTVVDRCRVPFADIDEVLAREIFIRGALVENANETNAKRQNPFKGKQNFASHNQRLLRELEDLENRLRRRDIQLDDDYLYEFYNERIPAHISNLKAFEKWRQRAEAGNPGLLCLNRDSLLARAHLQQAGEQFPKNIHWKGIDYPISYRFEPSHEEDGVSVTLAIPLLHQAPNYLFEWLVPGLLRDKCIALVKTLPKNLRRQFVPVPDFVDKALPGLVADNSPLASALGHQLKRHTGIDIPANAWQPEQLEKFYLITYRLVDERGALVARSKSLEELKQRFRDRVQETIEDAAGDAAEIRDITSWSFGRLKESQRLRKGKLDIEVYPALVDNQGSLTLKLLDNPEEAAEASLQGTVRLLTLQYPDAGKYLRKQLFKGQELAIVAAGLSEYERLREDIIFAAYKIACLGDSALPRTEQEFQRCLQEGKQKIVTVAQELETIIIDLLAPLKEVHRWQLHHEKRYQSSIADAKQQVAYLLRPGFLFETDAFWLQQYPRYIKALALRLEKLPAQQQKDEAFCREMAAYIESWQQLSSLPAGAVKKYQKDLEKFRYLLEEYRVSTFAQVLKTVQAVSAKRLAAFLAELKGKIAGN
ncbi:MAG: ATP-dependent RNA helicase HrpA [Porticoccaceae bacterium]